MDKTETYVAMCERATEIQEEWRNGDSPHNYNGDFYFRGFYGKFRYRGIHVNSCLNGINGGQRIQIKSVWLPRQDQLQGMLDDEWYELKHFPNPRPGFKYEIMFGEGLSLEGDSLEPLLLVIIMQEKYGKVWNGEDWVKV